MNRYLTSIIVTVFFQIACAQDMPRVRATVNALSSYEMGGRGASGEGDKKAATYLVDRFSAMKLLYKNDSYLQYFTYNINTFPKEPLLKLDGKKIRAGYDFIPDPSISKTSLKLKQQFLDSATASDSLKLRNFLKNASSKKILVYNESYQKKLLKKDPYNLAKLDQYGAQAILRNKKLTLGLSDHQESQPLVEVMNPAWNRTAKKIQLQVEPTLITNYKSANIAGFIPGTENPDSILVITAHYDHLGRMGDSIYFPGANDNASGISMLLELADYYTQHPPKYTIWFIAFSGEEAGLIGSKYFTEHPLFPLKNIRFLINLDLMGSGDEGMMAVNGTVFTKEFALLEKINNENKFLTTVKKRGKAANSDHYFFSEKGVPAFFFYTLGGGTAYHDVYDVAETLPLSRFQEVFSLLKVFIGELQ